MKIQFNTKKHIVISKNSTVCWVPNNVEETRLLLGYLKSAGFSWNSKRPLEPDNPKMETIKGICINFNPSPRYPNSVSCSVTATFYRIHNIPMLPILPIILSNED